MYRPTVIRRRLLAALVLGGCAAVAFAFGIAAGDGAPARAELRFEQAVDDGGDGGLPGDWRRAVASRFDDYGQPLACGGTLAEGQLGVASRTLPCGTVVTIAYRGRVVHVPVVDRGPYVEGRTWDLTGATAEALDFPGLGTVTWRR
jgi:hypothetical protein